ncbi:hypothetical protein E2986_13094 [Frieseomelitta varia]|uniref:Uncharacterized protein n=1 Tax=Frieseomelitta varia TaxID=561572 RepID=A0A833S2C9_9HYME|nr:hypothetical protein E2986_13094 [Frieseomelitta varia]
MAREEGTEAAALPKLLLDLIEQVEGSKTSQKHGDGGNGTEVETEKKEDDLQQEDIAHNLPKVRLVKVNSTFNVVSRLACLVGVAQLSRGMCSVRFSGILLGPKHLLQIDRYASRPQIGDLGQQNVHPPERVDIRKETLGEGDESDETVERPFGV